MSNSRIDDEASRMKPSPQIYVVSVDNPSRGRWTAAYGDWIGMENDIHSLYLGACQIEAVAGFAGIEFDPRAESLREIAWFATLANLFPDWAAKILKEIEGDADAFSAYDILRADHGNWRSVRDYVTNDLLMNEEVRREDLEEHDIGQIAADLIENRKIIVLEARKGVQIFRTDGHRRGHRLDEFAV